MRQTRRKRTILRVRFTLTTPLIIFRFAAVFRTFEGIYLLTRGGPGDATNVLSIWYYKTGFEAFKLGNAAAIAMLIVALSAAVYLTVTKVGKDEAI